jgi:sulfatase modifying factor 1
VVAGLCVANSVAIDAGYSIDATEVTRGQYAAWLATKPALPAASDPNCGWNTSYELDPTCWDASPENGVTDGDEHPVVCVNWCDAFAYCAGVGKRLCGKIGGGTNAQADLANANASEWYRACSSDGADAYPYGQTYSSAACDTYDHPTSTSPHTSLVVGSLSTCQSSVAGYQGVFDMAGNAYEWDDSCSGPGAAEYCQTRGGSIVGQSNCAYNIESARSTTFDDMGFRCCTN